MPSRDDVMVVVDGALVDVEVPAVLALRVGVRVEVCEEVGATDCRLNRVEVLGLDFASVSAGVANRGEREQSEGAEQAKNSRKIVEI